MCSLPPSLRVSIHVATKAAYLFVCLFALLLCYVNVEQKDVTFVLRFELRIMWHFFGRLIFVPTVAAGDAVKTHGAGSQHGFTSAVLCLD